MRYRNIFVQLLICFAETEKEEEKRFISPFRFSRLKRVFNVRNLIRNGNVNKQVAFGANSHFLQWIENFESDKSRLIHFINAVVLIVSFCYYFCIFATKKTLCLFDALPLKHAYFHTLLTPRWLFVFVFISN